MCAQNRSLCLQEKTNPERVESLLPSLLQRTLRGQPRPRRMQPSPTLHVDLIMRISTSQLQIFEPHSADFFAATKA